MSRENCSGFGSLSPVTQRSFTSALARKKNARQLVTDAFLGWLVTDGYKAYRSRKKRQRCLAHLIRKAIALTGAVDQKAAQIGQWILDDLRELIAKIAAAGSKAVPKVGKILARLTRVCYLGKKADHSKLQALAKEILNDREF